MPKAQKPVQEPIPISASPTKRFFVDMLTRDIDLKDAILDLLDNCIDGVARSKSFNLRHKRPYREYWAKIALSKDSFSISDNCGGISRELAERSAFMLGRPEEYQEPPEKRNVEMRGVYGIGMKRAIFKMGRHADVVTQTEKEGFQVTIAESWFHEKDNWHLPLLPVPSPLGHVGTSITVRSLLPSIEKQFSDEEFRQGLAKAVGESYSLIVEKGFTVSVNGTPVRPVPLVLHSVDLRGYKRGIAPYLFKGTLGDVEVDLKLGFYRKAIGEDELEQESMATHTAHDAGWTVACNDRVVLYRDKTRLTGWGEANVPSYHAQFNSVAGIVHFRSLDPSKLPVTTTKRGIEGGSEIYLQVKDKMREGLKKFTAFTNRFKAAPEFRRRLFAEALPRSLAILEEMARQAKFRTDPKIKGGMFFSPALPELARDSDLRWVKFTKAIAEIEAVSEFLFEKPDVEPSRVGATCFDRIRAESLKP